MIRESTTPLQEIICHMGSHSVTCQPAAVTFPPLPQPKLVLDLATPAGCKAELTWVAVISQDRLPTKYAVWVMTLFYPHVPKIFTRDLSSCAVCLILCNNSILLYCLIVLSYYTIILGLQVLLCLCLFLYASISCTITYAFVMCQ